MTTVILLFSQANQQTYTCDLDGVVLWRNFFGRLRNTTVNPCFINWSEIMVNRSFVLWCMLWSAPTQAERTQGVTATLTVTATPRNSVRWQS